MPEWKGKTRGGSLGYRIFIAIIKHLGLGFAYALLVVVVPYFVPFAPKSTKASWKYWREIHHKTRLQSAGLVLKHYFRFGQVLIDKVAALAGFDKKFEYQFNNYEHFLELLDSGSGVVLIGAHFGNWEIGGNFFGNYASKLNIVMYDAEYEKIKDHINAQTGGRNYNVIPVNDDDMATIFNIKAALDKREYVCFMGDRFINENKIIRHDFLGKEAKFPAGPFLIGSRMKKPVVFYFSVKEGIHKYSFNFFFAEPTKRNSEKKQEVQLLEQYLDVLEKQVEGHPEQWFNFYDFWK